MPAAMSGPENQSVGAQDLADLTIQRRLLWVMLLRVSLITALLSATFALNYRSSETLSSPSARFLLSLIATTYLTTIIYAVWYKTKIAIGVLAQVQLALDLVLWGAITYATGGIDSGFSALFDLWVIVWAVVLGGRAAYHCALGAAIVILCLGISMQTGIVSNLPDQPETVLPLKTFIYFLSINIGALFLVAYLVSSLVTRLERTGEGLRIERIKRADLAQLHGDIVSQLTVGIATTDITGKTLTVNPCGLEMLGSQYSDIEGKKLSEHLPDLDKQLIHSNKMRSRGYGSALRVGGERLPIEYIIAPLSTAEKEIRGFIVMFSDLTEIRKLESALEKSRRLAALGELAASLAHEIRNPLGAMSGAFQILSANTNLGEEDRSLLDIVNREIFRLEYLVNDMLDYARPRKAVGEEIDLTVVIQETVRAFLLDEEASERSIEVSLEESIIYKADVSHIKQVLINLLQNAVQATEAGDKIEIAAFRDLGKTIIEIRDSGSGIAEEYKKKIFEPFFSTRERGLGLGLALCRRIIDEHRGTIEVVDRIGGGSIFRITLPSNE